MERIEFTNTVTRDELIKMNSEDAKTLGLKNGDSVAVATLSQTIEGKVLLDEDTYKGTVSVTQLFGQFATDLQQSEEPDPMAKIAGLLIEPVSIKKL